MQDTQQSRTCPIDSAENELSFPSCACNNQPICAIQAGEEAFIGGRRITVNSYTEFEQGSSIEYLNGVDCVTGQSKQTDGKPANKILSKETDGKPANKILSKETDGKPANKILSKETQENLKLISQGYKPPIDERGDSELLKVNGKSYKLNEFTKEAMKCKLQDTLLDYRLESQYYNIYDKPRYYLSVFNLINKPLNIKNAAKKI